MYDQVVEQFIDSIFLDLDDSTIDCPFRRDCIEFAVERKGPFE